MKHFRHVITAVLAAVILAGAFGGASVTVSARTTQLADGTVFDSVYYAAAYSDVRAAFGTDYNALLNHYLTYGAGEGRAALDIPLRRSRQSGVAGATCPD